MRGWKQIADFLERDERTVRRWHAERAMPVYRAPGGGRSAVHAYRDELEAWQKSRPAVTDAAAGRFRGMIRVPRMATLGAAMLAVILLGSWGLTRSSQAPRPHRPDAAAYEHYLHATYLWEKRTADSLHAALDEFGKAIAIDPAYADAHAGVANTYNLLRQYGMMPAADAYAAAVEAGRRAVELDPANARTQASLAFAEFYGLRLLDEGIARFERARTLDPRSADIRHWLANALLHLGRFEEALVEINEAQTLAPGSRSVRASKGLALFYNGDIRAARAMLLELAEQENDFLAPRFYLSYIHLAEGDHAAFLDSVREAGRIRGDASRMAVADAGERGLRAGGFSAMVEAMIEQERAEIEAGRSLHYNLARLYALSGDVPPMLDELARAIAASEDPVMMTSVDPAFRLVTSRRDFRSLLGSAGLPVVVARAD